MKPLLLSTTILLLALAAFPQVQIPPLFAAPYLAAHPDSVFYIAIVAEILEGWAIPAANVRLKGLLPTRVSVEPAAGLAFGEVIYPTPQRKWLEFAKTYLEVYTGQVVFLVPVRVEKEAPLGLRHINLRLEYQACEAKLCLLPEVLELTLAVFIFPKPETSASLSTSPQARRASHPAHPQWILR